MLGSHNTFSYLPTNNLLKIWGKCQEVDYITQYNLGVRCFDIRVRFSKKGGIQIVHNNILYKSDNSILWDFLSFIKNKNCCIRIILDIRKQPKDVHYQVYWFNSLLSYIQDSLKIEITEAITFWNWEYIIKPKYPIIEKHASVTNNIGLFKTPKKYAKKHNLQVLANNKEVLTSKNEILLIDFVNL